MDESLGIKMARELYETKGLQMVRELFPRFQHRIAFGIAGEGSECFGFDDAFSTDHDYGAGFCMWLTSEDYKRIGQDLNREYIKLDNKNLPTRRGAMPIEAYFGKFTGLNSPPSTLAQWYRIPEDFLATATNGVVFKDDLGEFTKWREVLLSFYPHDIRMKKMSYRCAKMAQAGQYNFPRLIKRGELVAATMALSEFLNCACSFIHLANKRYTPYYKWAHRSVKNMPVLSETYGIMDEVASLPITAESIPTKIEAICIIIADWLRKEGLSYSEDNFLIPHSERLLYNISDDRLKNSSIMSQ